MKQCPEKFVVDFEGTLCARENRSFFWHKGRERFSSLIHNFKDKSSQPCIQDHPVPFTECISHAGSYLIFFFFFW